MGGGEQDQQRSFENRLLPYRGMVELSVEQNNEADALMYAERARGRVLLDVLQSGRPNITRAMTHEEQEREHALRAQAVSLNIQLNREKQQQSPDAARIGDLEARLQKARLAHETCQTGIYAAHPELKLQRGRMQPLTMDQISSLIPEAGTALLEFEVLDDKTFLFVVTGKPARGRGRVDLKVYTLPIKQKELADLTQRFGDTAASTEVPQFPPRRAEGRPAALPPPCNRAGPPEILRSDCRFFLLEIDSRESGLVSSDTGNLFLMIP